MDPLFCLKDQDILSDGEIDRLLFDYDGLIHNYHAYIRAFEDGMLLPSVEYGLAPSHLSGQGVPVPLRIILAKENDKYSHFLEALILGISDAYLALTDRYRILWDNWYCDGLGYSNRPITTTADALGISKATLYRRLSWIRQAVRKHVKIRRANSRPT